MMLLLSSNILFAPQEDGFDVEAKSRRIVQKVRRYWSFYVNTLFPERVKIAPFFNLGLSLRAYLFAEFEELGRTEKKLCMNFVISRILSDAEEYRLDVDLLSEQAQRTLRDLNIYDLFVDPVELEFLEEFAHRYGQEISSETWASIWNKFNSRVAVAQSPDSPESTDFSRFKDLLFRSAKDPVTRENVVKGLFIEYDRASASDQNTNALDVMNEKLLAEGIIGKEESIVNIVALESKVQNAKDVLAQRMGELILRGAQGTDTAEGLLQNLYLQLESVRTELGLKELHYEALLGDLVDPESANKITRLISSAEARKEAKVDLVHFYDSALQGLMNLLVRLDDLSIRSWEVVFRYYEWAEVRESTVDIVAYAIRRAIKDACRDGVPFALHEAYISAVDASSENGILADLAKTFRAEHGIELVARGSNVFVEDMIPALRFEAVKADLASLNLRATFGGRIAESKLLRLEGLQRLNTEESMLKLDVEISRIARDFRVGEAVLRRLKLVGKK